ncbi:anion permease [Mesorhizobium sp. LHD-90]|uniref:inorganic phosphate transporter n=1 Tax=Mesorhizobium sp. LHD-90 TaxID=3071414 RepID=UPI0027DF024E|nr:anion permease [Mesorhizobium sp. LHD-90]MDQ6433066.1 anion permease [Mesorhizobium sp. LHD-90]
MAETRAAPRKTALDKDLARLDEVGEATNVVSRGLIAPGIALLFIGLAAVFASLAAGGEPATVVLVVAAAMAAYMALNIGANDVANNVGPAVGAKVLTMGGALVMAAVCETAGALIAGSDVVDTISGGLILPATVAAPALIRVMLAALLAAALWINVATWIGAPVSTTHSIVGAVIGGGIAAAGFGSVNWPAMSAITLSWITSPILGGMIAASFVAFIETAIVYRDDKIAAARLWVPLLIALMAATFSTYLAFKGFQNIATFSGPVLAAMGLISFAVIWVIAHLQVRQASRTMENRNQSLKKLFRVPLIISAALLSFAHGANDVANAVGPLAAIVRAAAASGNASAVPTWVMLIGALGISVGLLLYGPRLVRMVGAEITRLNPMRAFCVALSTALTVIVASWFGLPVSSTHIAVGSVFGVGFFREWYIANSSQRRRYLERRNARRLAERRASGLETAEDEDDEPPAVSREEIVRRRLVRRAHVVRIVAAWVTTVPISALLSALLFLLLDTFA